MTSALPDIDPERADRFGSRVGDYMMRLPAHGSVGQGLKALREARGVTQVELAERLGTEQTHVSRMERSPNHRLSTIFAYVHALGGAEAELQLAFTDGARIALPLTGAAGWPSEAPASEDS